MFTCNAGAVAVAVIVLKFSSSQAEGGVSSAGGAIVTDPAVTAVAATTKIAHKATRVLARDGIRAVALAPVLVKSCIVLAMSS